jgi:hypothetical protein
MTDQHDQQITNNYVVHYPQHEAREGDPHYKDFNAYRNATKDTAQCAIGSHRGDLSECAGGLELHHAHIEFSLQNGVDLAWLEKDYPGVSNADEVGKWIESAENLLWLCEKHHRGVGGIHHASASDFEAEKYVRNLIGKKDTNGKVEPQSNA